jgi:hypothetical protein
MNAVTEQQAPSSFDKGSDADFDDFSATTSSLWDMEPCFFENEGRLALPIIPFCIQRQGFLPSNGKPQLF